MPLSSKYNIELPDDYFDIGIYDLKMEDDLHALWRVAYVMGADGVFTVGGKYRPSGTLSIIRKVPFHRYKDFDQLIKAIPNAVDLIGIDKDGERLRDFKHPRLSTYLLSSENTHLPKLVLDKCHYTVSIERLNNYDLSPIAIGSIIMWDRLVKGGR